MNIEGGISKIRKAIQGTAEGKASTELLEKPEQRHYADAFHFFKSLRALSPEKVDLIITIAAKSKDLKDEMGIELFDNFMDVQKDITERNQKQFNEAIKQISVTKTITPQQLSKEVAELNEEFGKKISDELKDDPRIVSAFEGKDELLKKGIDFAKSSAGNLSNAFEENPVELKEISWKETMEMIERYKRGKPTAKELKDIQDYEEKMAKKKKWPQKLLNKIINYLSGND